VAVKSLERRDLSKEALIKKSKKDKDTIVGKACKIASRE
jgi:hypothetical protein